MVSIIVSAGHMKKINLVCVTLLWIIGPLAFCQEQPVIVTACQLKNNPPAYNHKLVQVTAFVSHDFEDFTLFDPTCPEWPATWLEYGGTSKSGTMYCCGVTADRQRPNELKVEDISVPLTTDDEFRSFDKSIQPPFLSGQHGSIVHATVVGRFFAGREIKYPKGTAWGGYGHMGCCSLLVIEQIKNVDAQDNDDLDYGASPDQPDIERTGCGYRMLVSINPAPELLESQRLADLGGRDWVFNDPQRVATDALARFAGVPTQAVTGLKQIRKGQGRVGYVWRSTPKADPYMVVVSRPYWLSFYAKDSKKVAWVVAAAYVSSCGKNNSVTRIH